jgi:stage V sporulation protein AF
MRGVQEPDKEKTLRGAKDGFTEGLMTNIALIRRRIRDRRLIFESHTIGDVTKTDMALVYMEGVSDVTLVKKMTDKIQALKINTITVGEQTLIEMLSELDGKKKRRRNWLNPFPKVRYTQRPDVVAAHITEGKIAILIDNSPTVILLPTGIFDFMQDVDDYYFPAITGNYFRMLRIINFFVILFITPVYMLIVEKYIPVFEFMNFIVPEEGYAIPLFWQFIILEIAIDALKLASLNTPNSLGLSLSVVGALILGEFAVQAGWFIPQTILCMAVVALASFTQPSMELQYGVKFMRLLLLIGAATLGIYGSCIGLALGLLVMGTTKTLAGTSYLYPLIPFDKTAMKRLLFRTRTGGEK